MTFNPYEDAAPLVAPPMIRSANSITIMLKNKSHTILSSHANFKLLNEAVDDGDWADVEKLCSIEEAVKVFCKEGNIEVTDGNVFYNNPQTGQKEECDGYVVDRILQFMEEGIDAKPLMNFLNKLMSNVSFRVINDLYTFLSNRNMPLDADGDFYGYKAVRYDWMDKHSGQISNHIGETLVFSRNKVDDNPQNDCSYGLHVGSIQYVKGFAQRYGQEDGDRIVICKVNPANVVAVPSHDTTKLRCCKYTIVAEYQGDLPDTVWENGQDMADEITPYDDDDDDYDAWDEKEWCSMCGEDLDDCACDEDDDDFDEPVTPKANPTLWKPYC